MSIADAAREAAISLEAKKDGLSQRQDGSWLLRLRVHQNDDISEIAGAPMGQRYSIAMVAIADDETPLESEPKKQNRLTQRAAILCGESDFQNFLKHTFPMDWDRLRPSTTDGLSSNHLSEWAATVLRVACGVRSRREIVPGSEPAVAFEKIVSDYYDWRVAEGHG